MGREEQVQNVDEVDQMLAEAQHRGEPRMVAQLLRSAVAVRLTTSGLAGTAQPLLDEMMVHTRRHGLVVLEADAHALHGRMMLMEAAEDIALSEAAVALAMLDDDLTPDVMLGRRKWDILLASTLMDIGLVLTQLGVYEEADQVMNRAHRCIRESAGPHQIAVHMINRIRMLVGWGLRLERIGDDDQAGDRFQTAAAIAQAVEGPFRESLFPRRAELSAAEQVHVVAAAHALAQPSADHVELLFKLKPTAQYARELIITAIALARCLEHTGLVAEAVDVLADARVSLEGDPTEPTLRLCLVREFARLSGPDGGERTMSALESYAQELEAQLWDMRESRISTLNTRREHERLTRKHGETERQALQDPLTGLPNRRALDDRLETLSASPNNHPLALALVDLDGFKEVNDQYSHAEGDDVLRVIASTVRDALRGGDMVARYGGDEFVVLLPGAPLHAAEAALNRAVSAVSRLPADLSHGVTLSVGVVALRPQETAARALARADAAMYEAKRSGGNGVAAVTMSTETAQSGRVIDDPAWSIPEAT
ncbi:diguanylate cyclase (GGDEF)-like protein [Kibdelosporangium banguiense]|uniref:Diguanylate cyclase (GGDEF)-like protein n=1 Tax=Kibdelosporangium banguiense TaxID=1365924 RepID=A0ABS4T978_9PSEU|nr:tetratricopeptide repeat-containing diguanylate cyclase [Kibdelosporangium banguiense]MBP2320962.1 diguanylate cyclase (GGDEF)-like protein [Kibdelosporangium banguiense]